MKWKGTEDAHGPLPTHARQSLQGSDVTMIYMQWIFNRGYAALPPVHYLDIIEPTDVQCIWDAHQQRVGAELSPKGDLPLPHLREDPE